MKHHYRIRKNSPADFIIHKLLPILGVIAFLLIVGVLNTWELGLL